MVITAEAFRSVFASALFMFGLLFISAGFWKLMAFGLTSHAKTLAMQSMRLGQKSLTDDVTRMVQAAIQLNDSVNMLLRTSAGVGAFLIFVGFVFLAGSFATMFVA